MKIQTRLSLFVALVLCCVPFSARAFGINSNIVSFNVSGLFQKAQDPDLSDFYGAAFRFGYYVADNTLLFAEISFAEASDTPEIIDHSFNLGLFFGLTQYVPLTDHFALFLRAKGGVTNNQWDYTDDYYYAYDPHYAYYRLAHDEDTEKDETYLTGSIGLGFTVSLSTQCAVECGYDFTAIDINDDFKEDTELNSSESIAYYHLLHAGINFEF